MATKLSDHRRGVRLRLALAVVAGGAASLGTEICAARLVSPYFGDSILVWANIIGVVLAALSAGYWLGGRFADIRPYPRALGVLLLLAAAAELLLSTVATTVLTATERNGVLGGSLSAVIVLFSAPTLLLGMVAPWALRIAVDSVASSGRVAGHLYALSTVGSLAGTFASALLLIPLIGTHRTLVGIALLLAVAALPLVGIRGGVAAIVPVVLLALPPAAIKPTPGLLYERETQYQYVQVVAAPDGSRQLVLNEPVGLQSVWYPDSVLTGSEWDFFLLAPRMVDHPARKILVLGNAGGTVARAYARFYPLANIDGVEQDPGVTDAGRRYMGVNANPRLHVYSDDARAFLSRTANKYDVIVVDAYHSIHIPFHLATREFFTVVREHLTPGGILAVNVVDLRAGRPVFDAIGGTVAAAFPSAVAWRPLAYNEAVYAANGTTPVAAMTTRLDDLDPSLAPLKILFAREARTLRASTSPLTDDRAPVEWLTDLGRVAPGGLDGFPERLPTYPR